MSESCPKCGANRTQFEGQTSWVCGSYSMYVPGLNPFWAHSESEHCKCRQQLAALTQRAEQAEAFHAWLDKNNFGRHDDIALRIQELEEYVEKRRRNAWAFVQVANEAKTKLTAAKQRAEQRAEQAEREYDVLGHQHFELRRKLTAAESEVKRLREGIEALKSDIHYPIAFYEEYGTQWTSPSGHEYTNTSYVLDKMAELEASVDALLAQPSDGKGPTDAQ